MMNDMLTQSVWKRDASALLDNAVDGILRPA